MGNNKKNTIFRKEATPVVAGFHVGHLSRSNSKFEMLVFVEGGKLEKLEKNSQSMARTNSKLNPHVAPGWNQTWVIALTSVPSLLSKL